MEPNLYYKKNQKWEPLPDWCTFYFTLGINIGNKNNDKKNNVREILVMAVPTRAYISMMISYGLIYSLSNSLCNEHAKQKYFKEFEKLEVGTPLIRLKNNIIKKGHFKGIKKIDYYDNSIRIIFQETNEKSGGKLINLLKTDEIHKIQIGGHNLEELPADQKGREISRRITFLMHAINKKKTEISLIPDYQCVIIGNINQLEFELRTDIAIKNNKNQYIKGDFQDILRVEKYLRQGEALRTKIYSDRANDILGPGEGKPPSLVIFDGANSYIKWRNYWRETNWVIILNQTDISTKEAVEYIKEDFYQRRISNNTIKTDPLPAGIELMNYQEMVL